MQRRRRVPRSLATPRWRDAAREISATTHEMLSYVCSTQEGRDFAQKKLAKWYPAGLDMFGKAESARQYDYIRWGLRRRTNEEMRQAFKAEVDAQTGFKAGASLSAAIDPDGIGSNSAVPGSDVSIAESSASNSDMQRC